MTRFLLSLDSAVDTIFAAFRDAGRGRSSCRGSGRRGSPDVAERLIGERDIEIVETGIRPGEKIHEILVSEEEAFRTTERADHYVIESVLPELGRFDERRWPRRRVLVGGRRGARGRTARPDRQADFVDPAMGRSQPLSAVKVMTVVGTRPELIRLSLVFRSFERGRDRPPPGPHRARTTTRASRTSSSRSSTCPRRTPTSASTRTRSARRSARSSRAASEVLLDEPGRAADPRRHQQRPVGDRRRAQRDARSSTWRPATAASTGAVPGGEESPADRPHLRLAAALHAALARVPAGRGPLVDEHLPARQSDHRHARALPRALGGLRRARSPRARAERLRARHRPPPGDRGLAASASA